MVVRNNDEFDLIWTYFGFEQDSDEMLRQRMRSINMVGPAGYVSLEDGEATEICQEGVKGPDGHSQILMDLDNSTNPTIPMGLDENAVRGFWRGYLHLMEDGAKS